MKHSKVVGRYGLFRDRRVALTVTLIVAVVLVIGVGVGAWVGFRALAAKHSLESAQSLISDLQKKVTARDFAGAERDAQKIKENTSNAVSLTSDPIWRTTEYVPVLGQNLSVVRQLAVVVNDVADGAIDPSVKFASTFNLDSLKPVDSHINLAPLKSAGAIITKADKVIKTASTTVRSIDDRASVSAVKSAVTKLQSLLAKAQGITTPVRNALELLPPMMGADGARNYILLFLNNAESASLGGAASAWVVMHVENGAITITAQPSTRGFTLNLPTPMKLDPSLEALYAENGFSHSNNVTIRPDFPTAGKLAQAYWLRQSGVKVDGVLSFDPIALAHLLNATGPIKLVTGDTLTPANAVSTLLSGVYARYTNDRVLDAYFSGAAAAVFGALTSTSPDTNKLIAALTRSVSENRMMVWSDHPAEQAILSKIQLGGILDTTNKVNTQIGVFFNENSASKMSYYLKTTAALTSTACKTPDKPTFSVDVSLNSDLTAAQAKVLPAYVKSQVYLKPQKTRTQVYIYGPPGSTYATYSSGGGAMAMSLVGSATDLGRPVAHIQMDLLAAQTGKFNVTFTGGPGTYGPLAARVTPMVNPTAVTLASPGCTAPVK